MSASKRTGGPRVVIVGGSGEFGSRIARLLLDGPRPPGLQIVVTGRDLARAHALCQSLDDPVVVPQSFDHSTDDCAAVLATLRPAVLIDAAGPFGTRNYSLARAAMAVHSHYIDLADARSHVTGIHRLDDEARRSGVLVASGASTVPAVTTAALDALLEDGALPDRVDVGISPGYRGPRGRATVQSILSCCGRPVPQRPAHKRRAFGWGGLRVHRHPATMGARLLSWVDVPELDLWLERYPTLQTIGVRAGLAVPLVHVGLGALAWLVSVGLIADLKAYSEPLRRLACAFDCLGSDVGGMHVRVRVRTVDGCVHTRSWTLVIGAGLGPAVPATPAALLVRKLLGAPGSALLERRGALPCTGLVTLRELEAVWRTLPARILRSDRAHSSGPAPAQASA